MGIILKVPAARIPPPDRCRFSLCMGAVWAAVADVPPHRHSAPACLSAPHAVKPDHSAARCAN